MRDQPNKIMMNLNNAKSSTYRHTHNEQIASPMCIVEKATEFFGLPTIHTKLKHKMEMGKIHTHTHTPRVNVENYFAGAQNDKNIYDRERFAKPYILYSYRFGVWKPHNVRSQQNSRAWQEPIVFQC